MTTSLQEIADGIYRISATAARAMAEPVRRFRAIAQSQRPSGVALRPLEEIFVAAAHHRAGRPPCPTRYRRPRRSPHGC